MTSPRKDPAEAPGSTFPPVGSSPSATTAPRSSRGRASAHNPPFTVEAEVCELVPHWPDGQGQCRYSVITSTGMGVDLNFTFDDIDAMPHPGDTVKITVEWITP